MEQWFASEVHGELEQQVRAPVAMWRTEQADNTFTALPVRSDRVVTWVVTFEDRVAFEAAQLRLAGSATWRDEITPRLERHTEHVAELRLAPTARSQAPVRPRRVSPRRGAR